MPEVQQSTHSGEMAQRFIELVMMQAQQTAMFLGQLPGPDGQKIEPNLPYARLFIDQLEMLQEKTRGNLSAEETQVLQGVLSDLRLAFVQASKSGAGESPAASAPASAEASPKVDTASAEPEPESRKRFTKSYGS
ncbi:MAG: DUF1844 domain-containing protein [Terrimicrobiaceae bacterium]